MVRKVGPNFKNDHYHRSETSGRVCKTPRVVLERLNIPLDSVVLVRGNSIIYPLDNSEKSNSEVIDITLSEDDCEVEEIQPNKNTKFESTTDNSRIDKLEPVHPSKSIEALKDDQSIPPKLTTSYEASCSTKTVKLNKSGKLYNVHKQNILLKKTGKRLLLNPRSLEKHNEIHLDIAELLNTDSVKNDLHTSTAKSGDFIDTEKIVDNKNSSPIIPSPTLSKKSLKMKPSSMKKINEDFQENIKENKDDTSVLNSTTKEAIIKKSPKMKPSSRKQMNEGNQENVEESKDDTSVLNSTTGEVTTKKSPKMKPSPMKQMNEDFQENIEESQDGTSVLNSTTGESDVALGDASLNEENNERNSTTITSDAEQDKDILENKTDATPSRISQRIKNKKVKFSVLKLLAGGDLYSLKKELQSDTLKKSPHPKKLLNKTKANTLADINANNSHLSTTNELELVNSSNSVNSPTQSTDVTASPVKVSSLENTKVNEKSNNASNSNFKNTSMSKRKKISVEKVKNHETIVEGNFSVSSNLLNDKTGGGSNEKEVHSVIPSTPNKSVDLAEMTLNRNEKVVHKSPVIKIREKSNITSNIKPDNKIRVELMPNPEKKKINITVSPLKEHLKNQQPSKDNIKQRLNVGFGPDIVIRRVKKPLSDKGVETVEKSAASEIITAEDKSSETVANSSENVSKTSEIKSSNLVVKNLLYADKSAKSGVQIQKEVEVPPQIRKLLLETISKNKKNNESMNEINSDEGNKANETPTKNNSTRKTRRRREFTKKRVGRPRKVDVLLKEKADTLKTKEDVVSRKVAEESETSDREEIIQEDDMNDEHSDDQILNSSFEEENEANETTDTNLKRSHRISLKSINSTSKDTKLGDSNKHSKDIESLSSDTPKVVGKKTAKVTPLRQENKLQTRSESLKKTNNDTERINTDEEPPPNHTKSKVVPKLTSPNDLCLLGGKRTYRNAFEKYFICSEKLYEHIDCADSDSGSEDTLLLSHFIDLKRKGRENNEERIAAAEAEGSIGDNLINRVEDNVDESFITNSSFINLSSRISNDHSDTFDSHEQGAINEALNDITADLPKWKCHMLPDNSVICLILLDREESGTLDVKKCIEIDCNFKANVYVDKKLVSEYCGVYDSLDAIKNLIYQVDLL